MKKELLILVMVTMASFLSAQTFTEDFESYADGDKIAASSSTWTTWSGGVAGEDTPVSTDQAHSGTKSLKFVGASGGGPADIILPFGQKYTTGSFDLVTYMYMAESNGAYFNIQGTTTPGQKFTQQFFFGISGTFFIDHRPVIGHFNQDAWVKFHLNVDISHNIWTVYLDDEYVGSFKNDVNTMASIDFYARDGFDKFYLDDVSYEYNQDTPALASLNGRLNSIRKRSSYLTSELPEVGLVVRNTGTEPITSFDLAVSGASGISSEAFSNLNIASLDEYSVDLSSIIGLLPQGNSFYSVAISNVNGGVEADTTDNKLNFVLGAIKTVPNKRVLIEEGTGTWCQWCPRGAVFMDAMEERYPDYFVGIAVHVGNPTGDPMEVPNYASSVGYSSYPSMARERLAPFGFGSLTDVEVQFFNGIGKNPVAKVSSGITFDETTRLLSVSSQAEFLQDTMEQFKLAVILTEDHVTGTTSGYAQKNAYAGGGNGTMGGYENLPSTVPAAQMEYNHVGRALISPFAGAPNSLPANPQNGDIFVYAMPSYTIPSDYDIANLNIVTLLIDNTGHVVNANKQSFEEAMNFVLADNYVATQESAIEVYPNPITGTTNLFLDLKSPANVEMIVLNSMGQVVQTKRFGKLSNRAILPFDANQLNKGIYFVQIVLDGKIVSKRVVVQ